MTTRERQVRFGIIGCGSIAQRAMLPALSSSPGARLVAVASRSSETARRLAARFDCEAVTGYEALVERRDIDAVYIALPVGLHARWAIEAAKKKKHVLCEKTLAVSVEETEEIIRACQQNGVALLEGFAYQFHPQHRALNILVASGGIGEPVLFQAWFGFPPIDSPHRYDPSLGGGALLDAGAYTIHAARSFFGAEPKVLSADLEEGGKDVEIYGSVHLKFGKTPCALLAFGFNHMYRNCYSVWGTEGVVTLTRAFSIPSHYSPKMLIERQGCLEERTLTSADQFRREVDSFCSGLEDERQRRRWAEDALNQAIALEQVRVAAGCRADRDAELKERSAAAATRKTRLRSDPELEVRI